MAFHALRVAFRSLRRRPGFSALAVVTIVLGAGANAAVFAAAYGILLRPLPFAAPESLVAVWPDHFMSQVDLRYLRQRAHGLSRVSSIAPGWTFSLTGAGDPSKITIDRVSGDLFETLGARPLLGRIFRADEDRPGAPKVLILSHRYWSTRFNGDRSIVGRVVKLDDVPHEIVGVMRPPFEIVGSADAWAPLPADPAAFYDKLNFSLLIGRLAPGTTREQADRDFRSLMPVMRAELNYPSGFGSTARLQDLRESMTGDLRSSFVVLAAAVTFMLLIAAANLGTLLLASAASRAREFAVHAAIGASNAALVRLQLAEGLLLAGAGAAAGLALALVSMPVLVRLLPRDTPRVADIRLDFTVAGGVLCAAVLVALLFAIIPSLTAGRWSFATLLRQGASTESRATRRLRGGLVAVEIALALVLTIGAGLMVQTLWHLHHVDPGIDVDHILTLRLQPTSARYKASAAVLSYYDDVLARIRAIPGVRAAGAIQHLPFSGINWVDAFELENQPVGPGEARPTAGWKTVTEGYFAAVGQPILAGRAFTRADLAQPNPPVIVNRAFARRYFGSDVNALGQRLRQGRKGGDWTTIVGVAADVHTESLDRAPDPEFYTPVTGRGIPALMVAVRTSGDPLSVAAAAREAVWAIDRDVPVADLQPMRTMIGTTLARPRLLLTLLGSFAVAGLALGAIGVYGVVAFGVTRRRREIGIRVALGADRASIASLVLRESSAYAGAGLLAGLVLALASSRLMRGLLFEVPPVDPLTYGVLAAGVAALVALASYRPVRRAVAVDPAEALRSER